jgi:hypothetical protein
MGQVWSWNGDKTLRNAAGIRVQKAVMAPPNNRMKLMITPFLIIATLARSGQAPPPSGTSCAVQAGSVLSRSPSGVVRVSNLPLIPIECRRSPRRPLPQSGQQGLLKVEAVVYQVTEQSAGVRVPSQVTASGGGGDLQEESVYFYLDIPIDDSERDAASRAFVAELARRAASSPNETERAQAARFQGMDPRTLGQMVRQHRVGRFRVEFRVLDDTRLVGVATLDLEVVFKGTFFDQILRPQ